MDRAGGFVDLKLDHYDKDGIEVVDVEGEIDVFTAPQLRELLIELVSKDNCQLVVNMQKVEFLDSAGLGVLVGGLKRVRALDGWLDLACTRERILKIFQTTGLTKVFGIYETVDQAIAARKGPLPDAGAAGPPRLGKSRSVDTAINQDRALTGEATAACASAWAQPPRPG